ncbi:lamin tail domain-containing protein [Nitriliruptor alkaliphilus]|uniref:lamin tail domain-containing protein n=1 Tax=Nitriliruptor alkaliphilus TaxID=427918 RepID=UPI0006973B2E|nr:lamin tail domain-containing protein [Nitriliruptor alkaliphilus]
MRRRTSVFLVLALMVSLLPSLAIAAAADDDGASVVISQVYGGGGNSGAPYTNDFVEVFNRGDAPVDLSGMSIQYTSATGTGNFGANAGLLVALSGQLAPGQYHLVSLAGGATGDPLPTADTTGTINLAGASGKVALAEGNDSLGCNGGSTPCSPEQLERIVDLVGYGTADFYEGSGAAPTLSNTLAAFRADGGCTDTDDNAADFTAATPAPRNSSTDLNPCGGGEPLGALPVISQVYGGGGNSGAPYTNDFVEVFNRGDAPVDLSGMSIQYTSATGTGNFGANAGLLVALSGQLAPGQYHLVSLAGGATGDPLPTADTTGTINLAGASGKVALAEGTTASAATAARPPVRRSNSSASSTWSGTAPPTSTRAPAPPRPSPTPWPPSAPTAAAPTPTTTPPTSPQPHPHPATAAPTSTRAQVMAGMAMTTSRSSRCVTTSPSLAVRAAA